MALFGILALVIGVIILVVVLTLVRKAIKLAFVVGVAGLFLVLLANFLLPELGIVEKGKDYIQEKGRGLVEQGKDTITSFVVVEVNETIQGVKETYLFSIFETPDVGHKSPASP
ncbi:hypothetical protein HYV84_01430 [Candidatus Woesearchaeota archaeon]|nr:hypothetical protein [Candidatus Woesearchaeota archaeon]